jgi:thiol-disulfide isomerase/thioredoxin
MRNFRSPLGLTALLTVLFAFGNVATADDAKPFPLKYIPSVNHFTVATPGSTWLNVSRALKPEDLRDRIVLLDFWTYCCINCIQTLPELAKLEKEFSSDEFLVVGVHSAKFDNEKDTDSIRQAILRYGVEHPVVNDRDFRIWRGFNVRSWPTLVLLKPNGDIDQTWVGEGHVDAIRKRVRELKKELGKPKKAASAEKIPMLLEREKVAKGELYYPTKLAFDDATKTLFVSDSSHHQIAAYTWDPKKPAQLKPAYRIGKRGEAGLKNGGFSSARFRRPQGIAVAKGALYVADTENHVIRKVDLRSKTVSTIAGTGKQGVASVLKAGSMHPQNLPARSTALSSPWDVAFHPEESHLVIALAGSHQLASLDLKAGKIDIIAGTGAESIEDGIGVTNTLAQPSALASILGSLYFLDAESSALRFYFEGYVRTLVGSGLFDFGMKDGERKSAMLQHPLGLYADVTGVYIADAYNHAIRRYDPQKQALETLVGDGKRGEGAEAKAENARDVRMNEPSGITRLADSLFVIADTNNHRLLYWDTNAKKVERMRIDGEKAVASLSGAAAAAAKKSVAAPMRINVRLPNTLASAEAQVNRTNPEVRILLPEMYKLNAEGPSYLRLFEGAPPKETLKREWKAEELQSSLTLKLAELTSDVPYVLQGTLYYCLDAKNAVCEIISIDQTIRVDPSGTEKFDIQIPGGRNKR